MSDGPMTIRERDARRRLDAWQARWEKYHAARDRILADIDAEGERLSGERDVIIVAAFRAGATQADIARTLGVTRARVCQIVKDGVGDHERPGPGWWGKRHDEAEDDRLQRLIDAGCL